jgi:hypothetical protein
MGLLRGRWSLAAALTASIVFCGCGGGGGSDAGTPARAGVPAELVACLTGWNEEANDARESFGSAAYDGGARMVKFVRDLDDRCVVAFPVEPSDSKAGTYTFVLVGESWRLYVSNPPARQAAPPDPNEPAFGNFKNRAATQEAAEQARAWERAAQSSSNAALQPDGAVIADGATATEPDQPMSAQQEDSKTTVAPANGDCGKVSASTVTALVRVADGDVDCATARRVVQAGLSGAAPDGWTCAAGSQMSCEDGGGAVIYGLFR